MNTRTDFKVLEASQGNKKIHIVDNATPVIQPPRKYPVHMREELKRELKKNGRPRCDKKVGTFMRSPENEP